MFSISYNFNFNLLCRYLSYEAFVHCAHCSCCCACCSLNICFVYFCEYYMYADFLENLPMYWSGKHCFLSLFLLYAGAYFVSEMRKLSSFCVASEFCFCLTYFPNILLHFAAALMSLKVKELKIHWKFHNYILISFIFEERSGQVWHMTVEVANVYLVNEKFEL